MDEVGAQVLRRKLLALFASDPEAQREIERQLIARPDELEPARLLRLLAPLERRRRLGSAQPGECFAGIPMETLRAWFERLDRTDPLTASILDLRFFAHLWVKHIAALLDLHPTVIRRKVSVQKERIAEKVCDLGLALVIRRAVWED